MISKTRPKYSQSITVKCTPRFKKVLESLAWDKGDGVSRLIRLAVTKTYPEIKGSNEA